MTGGAAVTLIEGGTVVGYQEGGPHGAGHVLLPDAQVPTLVDGMLRVLTDAPLRDRMAREGPLRAAAYDWKLVTRRYLDLMIPIAQARGSR